MKRILAVFVFISLLLRVASAQSGSTKSSGKHSDIYLELAKAPARAAALANPLEHDPDAVVAGAKLFGQHCAECHGELANGSRRGPSLRAKQVEDATPGTLFWLLTNGVVRKGMPVWSKLPEPERWQLVSYIKSLSTPASR